MTGGHEPRQQRAQQRKDEIVTAAAETLARDGIGAVSHRTVAQRAGVPLGSTTYYFRSLDELLAAAAGRLAEHWIAEAEQLADEVADPIESPARAAQLLVAVILPRNALTHYEWLVGAGRRPAMAEVLRAARPRFDEALQQAVRAVGWADRITGDHALAVVDGAAISALSEGRDVVSDAERLLAAAMFRVEQG